MNNNLKFLLPLTPYLTCQIDTISDVCGGSNSAIVWFAGSREAALAAGRPDCDLEGRAGRSEKQVSLFLWSDVTVSRLCQTYSAVRSCACWYQAAGSNAFDLFRRQFKGHTVCCWTCIPGKPNVVQYLDIGIQDADRPQMHRT